MDAVLTAKEVAKIFKCHTNTIRVMEDQGKLHRLENIPGVKYSAEEVQQLICLGPDVKPLTAWEHKKLEALLREKDQTIKDLRARLTKVMQIAQGGTP